MKRFALAPLLVLWLTVSATAAPQLGGAVAPDGKTRVTIDMPLSLRHANTAGRDGYGLCVFWSITHAARWQKESPLEDFGTFMEKERGGGWPEKVDQMIAKHAPGVDYFQYEGRDPVAIQALLQGGRMPSVTYCGLDPHYRGAISHMVNVVHYDERWVAILDNNYIGENDLVWMTPAEFLERWRGKGSGWVVGLFKEPPRAALKDDPAKKLPGQVHGDDGAVQYVWYYHKNDPYRVYLYCEDELVGGYDLREGYFRFYAADEDRWLSKGPPPFPVPEVTPFQPSGVVGYAQDYGIPLNLFPPRTQAEERWTRRGQAASRADILKALEPRRPPDPPRPDPSSSGTVPASGLIAVVVLLFLSLFGKEKLG
jgi:hypothetical protein